jgi:hypothetical protein
MGALPVTKGDLRPLPRPVFHVVENKGERHPEGQQEEKNFGRYAKC